jgi:hypothetical protein
MEQIEFLIWLAESELGDNSFGVSWSKSSVHVDLMLLMAVYVLLPLQFAGL